MERHDRLLFQEYLCTKAMHSCNSQIPLMPGAPASAKMAAPFLARYSVSNFSLAETLITRSYLIYINVYKRSLPQPYNRAEYLNINYKQRLATPTPSPPSQPSLQPAETPINYWLSFRWKFPVSKGELLAGFTVLWRLRCFSAFSSLMAALQPSRETPVSSARITAKHFDRSSNLSHSWYLFQFPGKNCSRNRSVA